MHCNLLLPMHRIFISRIYVEIYEWHVCIYGLGYGYLDLGAPWQRVAASWGAKRDKLNDSRAASVKHAWLTQPGPRLLQWPDSAAGQKKKTFIFFFFKNTSHYLTKLAKLHSCPPRLRAEAQFSSDSYGTRVFLFSPEPSTTPERLSSLSAFRPNVADVPTTMHQTRVTGALLRWKTLAE